MLIKNESVILNLSPQAALGLANVAEVFSRYGLEAVVTSGKDSRHGENSLHHQHPTDPRPAHAFDVRLPSRRHPGVEWDECVSTTDYAIVRAIREKLGPDFDVVLEIHQESPYNWHLHVEYDPRG